MPTFEVIPCSASCRTSDTNPFLGAGELLIGREGGPLSISPTPAQHSFICGRTGSGKTTLLLRLMAEHMRLGIPFLFIDFHGQATDSVLALVGSQSPTRRVLLLEPGSEPVIGWNPLDAKSTVPYGVVQDLITIFHRRLWPDAWGPRLEELLRMTLLPLAEIALTLLEAPAFLSRPEFRRSVLRHTRLSEVREFWMLRFERLSPSQRALVTETVHNKLSAFYDPALKHVIGQSRSTLDFDVALREGQTVIANLSGGTLQGNSFLLAALLVAAFKAAVYRRPTGARAYAVFLDEFQEMIALDALDDYLRSFRKFACPVYLATQHLELSKELKSAIFGNCSRFFAFATSASDAAFLGHEFGPSEGEVAADLLPDLPVGCALTKVRGEPSRLLRVAQLETRPTTKTVHAGRARCLRSGALRDHIDRERTERMRRFSSLRDDTADRKQQRESSELEEGYDGF